MALQPKKPLKNLLCLSFNQDAGCFACGTSSGFRVFETEPFAEHYHRNFGDAGVCIVESLFRSNILALVGGGPVPRFPPNKVIIWDDHQGRAIGELAFRNPVRAVKLRKDRVAVALEQKVLLYDVEDLRLIQQEETLPNPDGLLALSPSADFAVLAYPGVTMGKVRVELLATRRTKIVNAHNSEVAALALSANGKVLATASKKGTLVRVFSTADGSKLREVRRGSVAATIYSLAFSRHQNGDVPVPDWLAATSDSGTVHVFNLRSGSNNGEGLGSGQDGAPGGGNPPGDLVSGTSPTGGIKFAKFTKIMPYGGAYLASEWSWAQYRLPDSSRCVVAFGKDPTTLLVASTTGAFHTLTFDPEKKGPCDDTSYTLFLENEEFEDS